MNNSKEKPVLIASTILVEFYEAEWVFGGGRIMHESNDKKSSFTTAEKFDVKGTTFERVVYGNEVDKNIFPPNKPGLIINGHLVAEITHDQYMEAFALAREEVINGVMIVQLSGIQTANRQNPDFPKVK